MPMQIREDRDGHTPPTIFADWGDESWEGHVGVKELTFGTTIKDALIESQGSGYLSTIDIMVVDGRPRPTADNPIPHPQLDATLLYQEATFEVNATDENGSILDLNITFGGSGYEPTLKNPFTNQLINTSGIAKIIVSGGGGTGAVINGVVDQMVALLMCR